MLKIVFLTAAAVGTLVTSVPAVVSGPVASEQSRAAGRTEADRVLARARQWLGGAPALANVRSLQFERGGAVVRILFPDRYAIELLPENGGMRTSFDGRQMWTVSPGAAPRITGDTGEHKVRGLRRMAEFALMYALRVLPTFPLTPAIRHEPCAGIAGTCIEFQPSKGEPMFMVFATHDGRPTALIQRVSTSPGGPAEFESISLMSNYRRVQGVQFPFEIVSQRRSLATGNTETLSRWPYTAFVLNPSLAAADFLKPR